MGDHGGPHIQNGNMRWDAETLPPLEHKRILPPALTDAEFEGMRKDGVLDQVIKRFPNGRAAQIFNRLGMTGKALKLSATLAKPLCKALDRVSGPLALVGAASDAKAIGDTAVTGVQAASAANNAIDSSIDTQKKVNAQLNSGDDLSDDDITHYMQRRVGGFGK